MSALIHHWPVHPGAGRGMPATSTVRVRRRSATAVARPSTPLLACTLLRIDWSDAYGIAVPFGARGRPPEDWAEAIFQRPPPLVHALFVVRELLVRACGIEPGTHRAFDVVAWSPDEVLLGIDQRHLAFRASVLLQPDRVVVSTVVEVRNRRGRAYFALVRRIHPWVIRTMLARAVDAMAVPA
jgi:Protein of unknown function (DUF2867)